MIGYVTLGSNDVLAAAKFYEAILSELGVKRLFDYEAFVAWGQDKKSPLLAIIRPHNREPASVGNGVMIALRAENQEQVKALHARAMRLGAQDEGQPGMREGGYYCAYFRDLDGNKLNFFCVDSSGDS